MTWSRRDLEPSLGEPTQTAWTTGTKAILMGPTVGSNKLEDGAGMIGPGMIHADTIPYYTILYYTILYYTILYYTILYYTILYYTILYYTILYYTTLHLAFLLLKALGLGDSHSPTFRRRLQALSRLLWQPRCSKGPNMYAAIRE